MPETVKDLVVRLSFEHGDTKSQIAAIKNEIQAMDSAFRAAAAEAGGFSGSLNATAAQADNLKQKIALQEQAVQKYATALEQANTRLDNAKKRYADYGARLEEAREKQATLAQQVEDAQGAWTRASAAMGKNSDEALAAKARLDELKGALQAADEEVKSLEKGWTRADQSMANADKGVQRATINYNNARAELAGMKQELSALDAQLSGHRMALQRAGAALTDYGGKAAAAGNAQAKLGGKLSIGSAAIVAAGKAAAGAAVAWESSFAGVRKTVNGTADELAAIEEGLLNLGEVTPTDYSELAGIAENAGQLGIATQNVLEFTKAMAALSETTDMTADSASTSLSQYMNIVGMNQNQIGNLGSTVVELGNNMATTESKIVDFATRIAAAGNQAGMTNPQIFAIAAGLSSLGLEAQAGGTAFSKALSGMQVAVETGSEDLKQYAQVAGMTAERFAAAFREDAAGAFISFVQGLSSGSQSAIVMLDEMGISEVRMRDALLRASNAGNLLTGAIDMANKAWRENTALTNEAAVRYGTAESRMQMLGNRAQRVGISFGQSLMPALEKGMDAVDKLVDKFSALDEEQRTQILTWAAYAAAAGPAILLLGKANAAAGSAAQGIGKLLTAMSGSGNAMAGLGKGLAELLGPVGIAAAAAAAGYAAVKFVEWASGARDAKQALEEMDDAARRMRETQAETMYDSGSGDAMGRFGVNEEDFSNGRAAAENWMAELTRVWSDGERETDAQVQAFTDRFRAGSDDVRSAIEARGALFDELGMGEGAQEKMRSDLAQLEAWDAEVAALLEMRQNGTLSVADEARLNEVIELRAQLKLEYNGGESSGYAGIIEGLQAEIDRALAGGATADAGAYGDALTAVTQGYQAATEAINANYDARHAEIMAIDDEAARTQALAALDGQYREQRNAAEADYRAALQQTAGMAMESGMFDEQIRQVDQLAGMLGSPELDLTKLADFTQGLDEGKMASLLAMIAQLKDAGIENDAFAQMGLNADDLLSKIQQIRDAADGAGLDGLSEIISQAIPEEVQRVLVGLNLDQAATDWENFMADKKQFETAARIHVNPLDEAAVAAWNAAHANVALALPPAKVGVTLGADWISTLKAAFDAGKLEVFDADGVKVPLTAEVLSQIGPEDIAMVAEDGTIHVIVTPEVGSPEGVAATQEKMDAGSGAPLVRSTGEDAAGISAAALSARELRAEMDAIRRSPVPFDEYGRSANDYADAVTEADSAVMTMLGALNAQDLQSMGEHAANLMAALSGGGLDSKTAQDYATQLNQILDVVGAADQYLGTGNDVSAGIAEGMNAYGWSGDAATVAEALKAAVDAALGVASPATTMMPTGVFVSAGVGEGMRQYSFAGDAASVAAGIAAAFGGMGDQGRRIGAQFGQGLSDGLSARLPGIISRARAAANQISNAFRSAWQIHSPSRVAEGLTRMFGAGLEKGMDNWPTVDERVLSDEVLGARRRIGNVVNHNTDARDYSVSAPVRVDQMVVREEADVEKISRELARQIRSEQRGRGA